MTSLTINNLKAPNLLRSPASALIDHKALQERTLTFLSKETLTLRSINESLSSKELLHLSISLRRADLSLDLDDRTHSAIFTLSGGDVARATLQRAEDVVDVLALIPVELALFLGALDTTCDYLLCVDVDESGVLAVGVLVQVDCHCCVGEGLACNPADTLLFWFVSGVVGWVMYVGYVWYSAGWGDK